MVKMTAEEVKAFHIEWEDIYFSSENSLYYSSFTNDSYEITAAWAIPEKMFSEWEASLGDNYYYYSFFDFIKPFKDEPVGMIVELAFKKA